MGRFHGLVLVATLLVPTEPAVPADGQSGPAARRVALLKDKPRDRDDQNEKERPQEQERQRQEQARRQQEQRDRERQREQERQSRAQRDQEMARQREQQQRENAQRAQERARRDQEERQRDLAAQRQREQEAQKRKADQDLRDRLKRDQEQQQQQKSRDQAAQKQADQEMQKRKADQDLRDRLKRAQEQQQQQKSRDQAGKGAAPGSQPGKASLRIGQGAQPGSKPAADLSLEQPPVAERAKAALARALEARPERGAGKSAKAETQRDRLGAGPARGQIDFGKVRNLAELPVPTREELKTLPRADLHAVAAAAADELEQSMKSQAQAKAWRDHLKLDALRKAAQSDHRPDPKTYRELREIAGRFESLARDDRYNSLRNEWGYQALRQTVSELAVPPVVRERRQIRDGALNLHADLGRLNGGDRWRDFLKLDGLEQELALRNRAGVLGRNRGQFGPLGSNIDLDLDIDIDHHHHHHHHHFYARHRRFWWGPGHWAFYHFRSRCYWGPVWRPPLPVAIALALARFRQIHDDPRYIVIAQLPSFQATYANLQGYADAYEAFPAHDWMADIAVVAARWGAQPQGAGQLIPFVDFTVANLADAPANGPIRFVFARHFDQRHPWFGYPSVTLPPLMPGESRIVRVRYPGAYPGALRQDARFPIWCEAVYEDFEWSKQNNRLSLAFGENFDAFAPPAAPAASAPSVDAQVIIEARTPVPAAETSVFDAAPAINAPGQPDGPAAAEGELPPPPPPLPDPGVEAPAPSVPRDQPAAIAPPGLPPLPPPPETQAEFMRALMLGSRRPPELPQAEGAVLDRAAAAAKSGDLDATSAILAEFEQLAPGFVLDWTSIQLTVVREAFVDGNPPLAQALEGLGPLLDADRQLITHLEDLGKLNDTMEEGGSASTEVFDALTAAGDPAKPVIVWKPRKLNPAEMQQAVERTEQALDELWSPEGAFLKGRLNEVRVEVEAAFKAFQRLEQRRVDRQVKREPQ